MGGTQGEMSNSGGGLEFQLMYHLQKIQLTKFEDLNDFVDKVSFL